MKNYFVCALCALAIQCFAQNNATITETTQVLKTYPYSDPDPIANPENSYYPYFRFDGFASKGINEEWNVVVLENDFIKVTVFPEVGGKIWGAVEKSTGHEFIYSNSVVKFRDIAMRGAWTSGGIELNFGIIGHAPTSATPVDYITSSNEDGSVSCFLSATDYLTRTRWETEVNLPKDKAYFTTTTTWHNPTPLVQPYYQWMNAAYQVAGDLEFCFPGNHWIGHDGGAHNWPYDEEGRDRSWYKNNNFGDSKSNHVLGGISDFYAAYWHDLNFGSGHHVAYDEKTGMKVFQWAHSRSGGIWEDLLTDTDGQYVEMQSGKLFNQAASNSTRTPFKHFGFEPYATDVFREYWFPVLKTGGVVKANAFGALNVEKSGDQMRIYFCPLQETRETLYIYFGEELTHSIDLNLDVLETWSRDLPGNPEGNPLRIVLGDNKLVFSEKPEDNHTGRPMEAPEDFDWNSVYGLYLDGQQWMYQKNYGRAFEQTEKCLDKDPYYAPALNQMAALLYRKADYLEALQFARKALSINTYEPEANFIYGLINKRLGILLDAEDGFSLASLTPSYRYAAGLELTRLSMVKGDLNRALLHLEKVSGLSNSIDKDLLLAVIYRKQNQEAMVQEQIRKIEKASPLNHYARFEKMLLTGNEKDRKAFTSMIRNELDSETYMEMACWYEDMGCTDEAIQILAMTPAHLMSLVKLAHLRSISGESQASGKLLEKALQMSLNYVLPFRTENIPALVWAREQSDSWKPDYLLALIHWQLGNIDTAKALFSKCGDKPDYPYFYMAKSGLFSGLDNYDAEKDLLKAAGLKSEDWRISSKLLDYYLSKNNSKRALEIAENGLKVFPNNDVLKYEYAKCLLADGQYTACQKALAGTVILPSEGARYGRATYRQACIMEGVGYYKSNKLNSTIKSIAKARLWPENLGVGMPYDVDERIEDFFEARCLTVKNRKGEAESLYKKVREFTENGRRRYSSTDYFYLLSLRQLKMEGEISDFLVQWTKKSPDDPMLKWCKAMISNDKATAKRIESDINTKEGGTPWDPRYADPEFEIVKAISGLLTN